MRTFATSARAMIIIIATSLPATGSLAATLTFDDLPPLTAPGEQYSHLGIHFYGASAAPSVRTGVSNGDAGAWGVDGSVGPYFMGINNGYGMTLSFDVPVSSFSLDAIRPAIYGDTSFSVYAYYHGTYVAAQTVNLRSGGAWTNVMVSGAAIDQIEWFIGGGGPYGIDNIQFTPASGSGSPNIWASPYSLIAYIGSDVVLSVRVSGQQPLNFRWYLDGTALPDATNSTLRFPTVQNNQAGHYHVAISNALGGVVSYTNTFTVISGTPVFQSHPQSQSVYASSYAYLYSYANGYPAVAYQWQSHGTNVPGATNSFLQMINVQTNQAGPYQVIASNASGSATSLVATLTVLTERPYFFAQPKNQTVSEGSHVEVRAYASGAPYPAYQWHFNGAPIAGETKYVLKLYNVSTNNAGIYTVTASNVAGETNSTGAVLTIARANGFDMWEWRNPVPQGNELSGIAYGNNLFVSVGRFGAIVSSADGTTWTVRESNTRNHLYSIARGNGRFVAIGSAGEVLASGDGIAWAGQNSGTTRNLYAITFTNGQFVAVGRFGTILTSSDGLSWTARASGTTNHLRGITYGAGKYVAVGSLGEIVTSPNGTAWTRQAGTDVRNLRAISFGNGAFVAVGNGGAAFRSTNGVAWSVIPYTALDLRGVSFVNGTFISVGQYGYVHTSSDGLAWIYNYTPTYEGLYDIARGSGNFVAVGKRGALLITTNNAQWFDQRLNADFSFIDAAYGAGKFVAAGYAYSGSPLSNIWVSTNGRTGTITNVHPDVRVNAILYAEGKFVAGGYECCPNTNDIWVSSNAVNWSRHRVDVANISDIAYGNGKFIAVGGGSFYINGVYTNTPSIALSADGENWTSIYAGNISWLQSVAAGNGVWLACYYNSMFVSTNATNWTSVVLTNGADYIYGAAYGKGIFVVVGGTYSPTWSHCVLISTDGFTWERHFLPINGYSTYPSGVKWVNNLFVVPGGPGLLLISTDGVNWVQRNSHSDADLLTVAYGQKTYLAFGGYGGAILQASELAFESPAGLVAGNFDLFFNGETGRIYRVQYSTDLQQWSELGSVTNTQPRTTFRDPGASMHPRRFYRLATP
jgi:hypothetical protein